MTKLSKQRTTKIPRILTCIVTAAMAVGPASSMPANAAQGASPAATSAGIVSTRRINESQYRQTIADLFGTDIEVNGRFEPEQRDRLLLAIGASTLSISPAGFDQYFSMAKNIADQVLDDKHRAKLVTCTVASDKAIDDSCTTDFVTTLGRKVFRRPLTEAEIQPRVLLAAQATQQSGNYYAGLKLALTSLLTAPQFLFRIERTELDPTTGELRLDGYSKAARLSYLLWNTTPDDELLAVAESGEIHSTAVFAQQVERLLASQRLEAGTRAFFADMLQLDFYETLTKDPLIFPKFSQAVAEAAKEQTLKTVVDLMLVQNGDYRDLFTTRTTFLDRSLASIYKVPLLVPEGWAKYEFPPDADQSGLLTQISVLGVFSHPGRSSPTKRGVAINEILLCEPTPLPPANVDFSIVNDTQNPNLRTVRSRLLAHSEDEACSGCHRKSDPLGLALERFDSLGQHRMQENGEPIDVNASLGGKKFEGARGLGAALHDNPKVAACVVRNVYAYSTGRAPEKSDRGYLDTRAKAFAAAGYRLRPLFRQIATSPEFFEFSVPKPAPTSASQSAPSIADITDPGVKAGASQ